MKLLSLLPILLLAGCTGLLSDRALLREAGERQLLSEDTVLIEVPVAIDTLLPVPGAKHNAARKPDTGKAGEADKPDSETYLFDEGPAKARLVITPDSVQLDITNDSLALVDTVIVEVPTPRLVINASERQLWWAGFWGNVEGLLSGLVIWLFYRLWLWLRKRFGLWPRKHA